jgi:hypothetical protein
MRQFIRFIPAQKPPCIFLRNFEVFERKTEDKYNCTNPKNLRSVQLMANKLFISLKYNLTVILLFLATINSYHFYE